MDSRQLICDHMIHFVYGCLDTRTGSPPLSSPLQILCRAVICVAKMRQSPISTTAVVAFTTSRYLIFMSCISHFSLPNPFHEPCSQTMNQASSVAFNSPPSHPLPSTLHPPLPLLLSLLVKTFVKSYFPLIKYSSVLQMYAWITCHTLSLLRMAPRWCS